MFVCFWTLACILILLASYSICAYTESWITTGDIIVVQLYNPIQGFCYKLNPHIIINTQILMASMFKIWMLWDLYIQYHKSYF